MYTHSGAVYEKHTHTNVKRKQNMFKNLQNKVSSIFCGKLIMEWPSLSKLQINKSWIRE